MSMPTFLRTLNQKMEPQLQTHMKSVYSCVALSTLAAALGGFLHLFTSIISGGFLSALGSIGFMLALLGTPDDGKNAKKRLSYLMAFSFLSGLGLGPLLDVAVVINPAVIPTAFFSTCLIFACFTLAAIFSNQRQYIYLGGTLMSLLSAMMVMGLLNIFIGSHLLFKVHIYVGLLVMCAFILYDTQVIIEKRRNGDKDFIMHSLNLFVDLIQIFRLLVVILLEKDNNKKK